MNILCIGDAYIPCDMMIDGVKPYLKPEDTLNTAFFGSENRTDMRNTVKAIEAMQRESVPVPDDLHRYIENCDVLIVHLCPITRKMIEGTTKLKAILSCRGGVENIDVQAATERGIIVTSNPAHNANAVAEYTIGMILCETRNIARADHALRNSSWREQYPNTQYAIRELSDMTVGIIGFGSVGRLVAERLTVFGCEVLISDPYISESAYDYINFKIVDLKTLLAKSDIITLHARSQKPILSHEEFSQMKPNAYLINTARSILIDSDALEKALENQAIMGAAIDVFESEPYIPEFYKKFDNVTITNHRGGDTINSYKDSPAFVIKNYLGYLNGERLRFWVNK